MPKLIGEPLTNVSIKAKGCEKTCNRGSSLRQRRREVNIPDRNKNHVLKGRTGKKSPKQDHGIQFYQQPWENAGATGRTQGSLPRSGKFKKEGKHEGSELSREQKKRMGRWWKEGDPQATSTKK